MNSMRVKEIACVVILLLFIVLITNQNKISDAKPKDVYDKVCSAVNVEGLKKSKNEKFKKEFGFGTNEFEKVYYLSSDSVMDVREILVVKLREDSPTDDLMESIEKRVEDKGTLFKGYAPEESALLEKSIVEKKDGFILFVVSESPKDALSAFRKAL